MTMIKKKEPIIERVFWPEDEKTFPSENRRVPKIFIAAMPLDKMSSQNKEENTEEESKETEEDQGKMENIKMMKTKELKVSEPFSKLFPIEWGIISQIRENMETHGYDWSHPVVVWKEKGIVIDGHTRVEAALELGIKEIPVCEKDFTDEDEALNYAVHCQVNRRNLTDAEIFHLVEKFDQRAKIGRPSKEITSNEANKPRDIIMQMLEHVRAPEVRRTSKITASLLKTSATKIEKVRTVLDKGDEKIKAALLAGEITIHKAYADTLKKPKSCIQKFGRDGLKATLTLSKDLGEVKWIVLGFGDPPNQESAKSIILHTRK
jgi:hypothetical protein